MLSLTPLHVFTLNCHVWTWSIEQEFEAVSWIFRIQKIHSCVRMWCPVQFHQSNWQKWQQRLVLLHLYLSAFLYLVSGVDVGLERAICNVCWLIENRMWYCHCRLDVGLKRAMFIIIHVHCTLIGRKQNVMQSLQTSCDFEDSCVQWTLIGGKQNVGKGYCKLGVVMKRAVYIMLCTLIWSRQESLFTCSFEGY